MNQPPQPPRFSPVLDLSRLETGLAGKANYSRRPSPPRSLIARSGTLAVTLTWNAPADPRGVVGYRVWSPDENTLIADIPKGSQRQHTIRLSASTKVAIYVSSYSALNRESAKIGTIAGPNADPGTQPSTPPGYTSEPSGGRRTRFPYP